MFKKIMSLLLSGLLVTGMLTGCSGANNTDTNISGENTTSDSTEDTTGTITGTAVGSAAVTITEKLKDEDTDSTWEDSESTRITLSGSTAAVRRYPAVP